MEHSIRLLKNAKKPLMNSFLSGERPELVNEWYKQGGNVGNLTGDAHNLVVLDLDNHSEDKIHGDVGLKQYMDAHNLSIPETYTVLTASGGLHLYFTIPEQWQGKEFHQQIKVPELAQIDFQHNKRYVVAEGSHIGDDYYRRTSHTNQLAELPDWVFELYYKEPEKQSGNKKPTRTALTLEFMVQGVTEGSRNQWLTTLIGKLFATGATAQTVAKMAVLANNNFVNPPVDNKELKTIFKSIQRSHESKL